MIIKYPVRLTYDYQIVDNENKVVVPELTWRNDAVHLKQQREVGELVVVLMNKAAQNAQGGPETPSLNGVQPERLPKAGGRKK